ncbi:MAG: UDP-N-acetylmuramoyl-L-alanine--D-glutamate ligase [Firmicutes bacterium]|nr:UDP-N-acetylmuramoyl-L-alanine--D-glutamate ligase [Bacillota bacterium]
MKAIIIGMGKSGKCAMYALNDLGYELSIQDSKSIEKAEPEIRSFCKENNIEEFYGTMPDDFSGYDMMVLSPGVDPEKDFVVSAKNAGCEIVGELELAFRLAKGTFIGITGTNGKTTTTTLVGEVFSESGRKTNVVGNIGLPVISVAQNSTEEDWMVTEVSSFQLQTVSKFRPKVSAILNLTPDHLNRHHTMELYGLAKAAIWQNQGEGDYLIMNADDPVLMKLCLDDVDRELKATLVLFSRKKELDLGAYLSGTKLVLKDEEGTVHEIVDRSELKIIGDHNVENALAAAAICFFSSIDMETIRKVLRSFGGVEHRLEYVDEIDGVKYYNDSKGTNTDAASIAIKALEKDIILIAGGDAKEQDFTDFAKELDGKVKTVILFGRDRNLIKEAMDKAGYTSYLELKDLEECVNKAHELAVPGDKVLLSPACASWDMYPNFEVRGKHFKDCVKQIVK